MKKLKFIWLVIKMLFLALFGLNFIPAICIGVVYFRGNLHEVGWLTPYIVGWSIQVIILFAYCIHDIMRPTYKF
jgi:hypothetical protein